MKPLPQRLVVIAGPTASGKSALAAEVARRLHTALVSADSRQVYRGLDLGTGKDKHLFAGKPGQAPVDVKMIDVAAPSEVYSLYRYQQEAYAAIEAWHAEAGPWHPLIVCGGTGLYLEALLRRYAIANVPEDEVLRARLMGRPLNDLLGELQALDPEWAARTDVSSKKRVVRALEVAYARQREKVSFGRIPAFDFDALIFVAEYDAPALKQSIGARLRERLEAGLIDEVRGLLEAGLPLARLQQLGLEYREVAEHLVGERDEAAMVERLQARIEDFAKRQATWFRGMPKRGLEILALPREPREGLESILSHISRKWPDMQARFVAPAPIERSFAVAVLCDGDGRILLLRRALNDGFAPGLWGLPGGHLQPGETSEQAVVRELKEELGVQGGFTLERQLPPVRDSLYGGGFEVHLFKGRWDGNEAITLNEEHCDQAWVAPEAYRHYAVVPGVDEDLAYLQVWPLHFLNLDRLPSHLKS